MTAAAAGRASIPSVEAASREAHFFIFHETSKLPRLPPGPPGTTLAWHRHPSGKHPATIRQPSGNDPAPARQAHDKPTMVTAIAAARRLS
ncbi:MAG TPA: hypothetical protein VKI45_03875 [Allosphingosinicella sp.]|nr:hypothetical protein [Allosphingosinicella sp.]